METVEKRALKIAAICLTKMGCCRYDDDSKCRRVRISDAVCARCIEKWLLTKAKAELDLERAPTPARCNVLGETVFSMSYHKVKKLADFIRGLDGELLSDELLCLLDEWEEFLIENY